MVGFSSPEGSIETPDQLSRIYVEERRIGRSHGELWPETNHQTTEEYIAFLKRVPTGSRLAGLLATLAKEAGAA